MCLRTAFGGADLRSKAWRLPLWRSRARKARKLLLSTILPLVCQVVFFGADLLCVFVPQSLIWYTYHLSIWVFDAEKAPFSANKGHFLRLRLRCQNDAVKKSGVHRRPRNDHQDDKGPFWGIDGFHWPLATFGWSLDEW